MKVCPKCGTSHDKNGKFCSRSCGNSRTWSEEDRQRKRDALNIYYSNNTHPMKGKPGWIPDEAMKELKRQKNIEHWDKRGRRTKEQRDAQVKDAVHRYRARRRNATPPDADLELIKKIMAACPKGYDVDHIVSLSNGGLHHQDNLQYLPLRENRRKNNRDDKYDKSLVVRWQDVLQEEF